METQEEIKKLERWLKEKENLRLKRRVHNKQIIKELKRERKS